MVTAHVVAVSRKLAGNVEEFVMYEKNVTGDKELIYGKYCICDRSRRVRDKGVDG